MWAIEDSPGPKAAYRGGGIILPPAILLVETMHFGCVELVEQHGSTSTRSSRRARHVERVVSCRDVT